MHNINVPPEYRRAQAALNASQQTEDANQPGEITGRTIEVNTPGRHSNRISAGSFQGMRKAVESRFKNLCRFSPSASGDSPQQSGVSPVRQQHPEWFAAGTSRASGSASASSADQTGINVFDEMVTFAKELSGKTKKSHITRKHIESAIRARKPKDSQPASRQEQDVLARMYARLDTGEGPVKFHLTSNMLLRAGNVARSPQYKQALENDSVMILNSHNRNPIDNEGDNARLTLSVQPSKVYSLLPRLAEIIKNDPSVLAKVLPIVKPQTESVVIYLPADFEKAQQIATTLNNQFEGVMNDHITIGMHPVNKGIGYSENSEIDNTEHRASGSHARRMAIVMLEAFNNKSMGSSKKKLKAALVNHGYNPDAPAFLLKKT
ncbi:MAG: T3SS effector HopA1 family protein [Reinekea sp.]